LHRYSKLCLAGLGCFLLFYLVAGLIAVIGVNGLFGFEENSLAVIWLIFLGMPWTMVLALLPASGVLPWIGLGFIALVPLFNLWLLSRVCRRRRRRRHSDEV
jgi:hypothetical protein